MNKLGVKYWDYWARSSEHELRDAILWGHSRKEKFNQAGRIDAEHLVLPFIAQGDIVADVGCGIGRIMKWVAPHCREIFGFDISKEMLAQARKHLSDIENAHFAKIPLSLKLSIKSSFFDFAYFYHVSEHLRREDTVQILNEIRRSLRPQGRALLQFSLINHPENQKEFRQWMNSCDVEGVRSRFYTESEVEIILSMVKFYPQMRLYIPGEFVVVVTKKSNDTLGSMPLVKLPYTMNGNG